MKNQVKRIAFVSLLSVLFLGLTFTAFSQTTAPSDEGLKMIEREQPKKGIEALRKDPNNYFNLGTGLLIRAIPGAHRCLAGLTVRHDRSPSSPDGSGSGVA